MKSYDKDKKESRCAIILAGGDGTRLSQMTQRITGDATPKQFCGVIGSTALLEQTRLRVSLIVREERILTVVTRVRERHYRDLLKPIVTENLVIQPESRNSPRDPLCTPALIQNRPRCMRGNVSVGSFRER